MSALANLPYDIIVFATLSLILLWRLRAVLGRKVNVQVRFLQRKTSVETPVTNAEGAPAVTEPAPRFDIPLPGTRVGKVLEEISKQNSGFSAQLFLQDAVTLFRDVVTAFARGDREHLAQLLAPNAYGDFAAAIAAREAENQKQRTEIVGITSLSIVDAALQSDSLCVSIDVQILSRQISLLNDAEGQPLVGTESITEFSDLWRFERSGEFATPSSAWRLAAARAA